MENSPDGQEWELNKENVMPIKEGRLISTLNSALKLGTPQRNRSVLSKIEHIEYEQSIDDYIGSDPLSPWIPYIQWLQQNCPTDKKYIVDAMEKCMQKFGDSPLYSQDRRFLQMWVQYADTQDFSTGKQTYDYLRAHKIGNTHALFFLAEAILYEENGKFERTEHIYQEGITCGAEPLKDLKHNQYHFHRRMRRKCITYCQQQLLLHQLVDPVLEPVEACGVTMAALRRLEELTQKSRPTTGSNRNFGVLQEMRPSSTGTSYEMSQGLQHTQTTMASELPFSVCVDTEPVTAVPIVSEAVTLPWKPFEKASDQRKENNVIMGKWSEMRLKQMPGSVKKNPVPFPVYCEPSAPDLPSQQTVPSITRQSRQSKEPAFGLRRDLFAAGPSADDDLSFEEYRQRFYTIKPRPVTTLNPLQTPAHNATYDTMDCDNGTPSERSLSLDSVAVTDPAKRRLNFDLMTPFDKERKVMSYANRTEKELSGELTVNTKGALKEIADIFGDKNWSNEKGHLPAFDIMSTVKKSQKRPMQESKKDDPFVDNLPSIPGVIDEYDKENAPVSYESIFKKERISTQTDTIEVSVPKRCSNLTYGDIIADIDKDDGSLTRRDSLRLQDYMLTSQAQSRKSSASEGNRISDFGNMGSFMSGRRDTQDGLVLTGVMNLLNGN